MFKRYDIRGNYPGEIDEEFAELLGRAIGTFSRQEYSSKVVVGRDSKKSSLPLKKAFVEGLRGAGVDVLDAGTGPTDYVALAGRENKSVSVQITSSHLPLDTNGFKFMYPEGNGFLNPDLYEVQDLFRERDFKSGTGKVEDVSGESYERYFEEVKQFFHQYFDSIDRKVVVDTLGGAANGFLPELLEELGAEVVDIAAEKDADEPYVDPPNPEPGELEYVAERVEEENADIALATDMDADRVAVYYGEEWLTGDQLFAVLAGLMTPEKVVASVDTSTLLEEVVQGKDGEVYYTRVGDPFVADKALEEDAVLAGEPNNHYCFPGFVPYNSGTLTGLLLSAADLENLLEEVPNRSTGRTSLEVEDNKVKEDVMQDIENEVREEHEMISDLDGVKFRKEGATVLARPSSRSPVIRVAVEAQSREDVENVLGEVRELVRNQ